MSGSLGLTFPRLVSSQSVISLTAPFTPRSLILIKKALAAALPQNPNSKSHSLNDSSELNAAVLVPLANIDGKPSVLLELRGALRSHAGEVR